MKKLLLLNVLGIIGLTPQLHSMTRFAHIRSIAKSQQSMRFPISLLAGTTATGATLIAGNVYASFNNYSKAVKSGETYNSSPNYNPVSIGALSIAGGLGVAKMQTSIAKKETVKTSLTKILQRSLRCGGRVGLFAVLAKPALDIAWKQSKPHIAPFITKVRDSAQEVLKNLE